MPANSSMSSAQLSQIAWELVSLANQGRNILNDPPEGLSPSQSNAIAADVTSLSNIAANLFSISSQLIFSESDSAFTVISSAAQAANTKVAQIQSTVGKINSIVNILGSVVSLGVAFGSGNFVSVLSAASNLATAVTDA
jgi:hypothetical protein